MSLEDIQSQILCHLIHSEAYYRQYHEGDIALDCENFLKLETLYKVLWM